MGSAEIYLHTAGDKFKANFLVTSGVLPMFFVLKSAFWDKTEIQVWLWSTLTFARGIVIPSSASTPCWHTRPKLVACCQNKRWWISLWKLICGIPCTQNQHPKCASSNEKNLALAWVDKGGAGKNQNISHLCDSQHYWEALMWNDIMPCSMGALIRKLIWCALALSAHTHIWMLGIPGMRGEGSWYCFSLR
jgi:hypothetical protein